MGIGEVRVTVHPSERRGWCVYAGDQLVGCRKTRTAAEGLAERTRNGGPRCSVCLAPAEQRSELDASGRCAECVP